MVVIVFIGLTSNVFALYSLNCSNATGSLKRVEKEIWGKNLIEWYLNGNLFRIASEKYDEKKILSLRESKFYRHEVFAAKVALFPAKTNADQVVDFVICESNSNDGRD